MSITTQYGWRTRDEWEAEQRRYAEHMTEHGFDPWDELDHPEFTEAEQREVDALAPEAIKTIRRACGRVERTLRQQHPEAGKLAHGPQEADLEERRAIPGACHANHLTEADVDRWYAAVDALTGAARDAFDDLDRLGDVRRSLHRKRNAFERPSPFPWEFDRRWPEGFDRPTSPELDRLRVLNDQAVARHRAKNRDRGRRMLADLESGVWWQRELEHRAAIEEWRRTGHFPQA